MKVTFDIPAPPANCGQPEYRPLWLPIPPNAWVLIGECWSLAEDVIRDHRGGSWWIVAFEKAETIPSAPPASSLMPDTYRKGCCEAMAPLPKEKTNVPSRGAKFVAESTCKANSLSRSAVCPKCKTKFSDLAPNYCPECGLPQIACARG